MKNQLRLGRIAILLAASAVFGPLDTVDAHAEQVSPAPYFADIEVVTGASGSAETASGWVFDDANRNGRRDNGEVGIEGVKVSNGRDIAVTDEEGSYSLPALQDMSVFVIQPAGWRVPTDERFIPQFAYQHKPAGSPKPLRYGGLAPTGPLPAAA